jgi:crotonobetainyl-CoA:carnitine CoA-transferase CaiB-like acyl-CoA transferase
MSKAAAGPLDGVTVLDLCSYLAGPYGCTLLADLGATVIKIESPQGDMLRQFPSSLAGESRFFLGANRGKRALALDLKQPEGLPVFHRMVETADVLVENFRPSVPARLGIDYPRLKAINPRLVYCGLTGYGDSGPLSEKGGFDQVLQCLSGMAVFRAAGPTSRRWCWARSSITSLRRSSPTASPPRSSSVSAAASGNISASRYCAAH